MRYAWSPQAIHFISCTLCLISRARMREKVFCVGVGRCAVEIFSKLYVDIK
jgi:hypothetical protein